MLLTNTLYLTRPILLASAFIVGEILRAQDMLLKIFFSSKKISLKISND